MALEMNYSKKITELKLNHKYFRSISNSNNGEVSSETIFHYRQKGEIVWATYEGGDILFGTLSGSIHGDKLEFTYQHQNLEGKFLTGRCESRVVMKNRVLRLIESWEWTCGDYSKGDTILEEVPAPWMDIPVP